MSRQNVEIIRRLHERPDPNEIFSLFDPEVVITNVAGAPETAPYLGHDGVRRWIEATHEAIGDFHIEADELIDVDEYRVVVVGRVCGEGTSSGLAVEFRSSTVYTFGGGRIVDARAYGTRAEALAAARVSE